MNQLTTSEQSHEPTLTERIFKGGTIILFFTVLTAPVGYAVRMLYSRILSIQDYGLFYAVLSFLSIFNNYNDLGLGASLSYYIPKFIKRKDYQSAWNSYKYAEIVSTLISILLTIVFFFLANWLSIYYFKTAEAKTIVFIFAIYHIADVFVSIASKFLVGLQKEELYSSREFLRLFFTLILSLLLIISRNNNIKLFAIAWTIAYILTAIIFYLFIYAKHKYLIRTLTWDKKLFNTLLRYGLPTIITLIISTLISSTSTFLLTFFHGVKDYGVYNIAWSIVSIPAIFVASISGFFIPLTSHLMEAKKDKVKALINDIFIYIPFFTFYFILFIYMFPSTSINLLFGNKWVELVKLPLTILLVGSIFSTTSDYLIAVSLGIGLVKERLFISILIAIINLIASVILIYKLGIIGAVISNSLIYLITVILIGRLLKREIEFSYPWKYYGKLLSLGGLLLIVKFLLKLNPTTWVGFISLGIIYTIIMALVAYYFKLFNRKMVKLLINYCKKRVKKYQYAHPKS